MTSRGRLRSCAIPSLPCAQSQGYSLRSPWPQDAERPGPGINRRLIGCRVTSAAQPIAGPLTSGCHSPIRCAGQAGRCAAERADGRLGYRSLCFDFIDNAAKNFSAGYAPPTGGARVKGTSIKYQGFRSWTSRKPISRKPSDGGYQLRFAERRNCGLSFQEPPRITARAEPSQLVVQALPSVGTPS